MHCHLQSKISKTHFKIFIFQPKQKEREHLLELWLWPCRKEKEDSNSPSPPARTRCEIVSEEGFNEKKAPTQILKCEYVIPNSIIPNSYFEMTPFLKKQKKKWMPDPIIPQVTDLINTNRVQADYAIFF